MNEAELELKLALCLLEKDCPAGHPLTSDYFRELGECSRCFGTNKVTRLDPALVRKPCPNTPNRGSYSEQHQLWSCFCQGRVWTPSDDGMAWVEALNDDGYVVNFYPDGGRPLERVTISQSRDRGRRLGRGPTLYQAAAKALGVER